MTNEKFSCVYGDLAVREGTSTLFQGWSLAHMQDEIRYKIPADLRYLREDCEKNNKKTKNLKKFFNVHSGEKKGPHQFTSPVQLGRVTLVQVLGSDHSESHSTPCLVGSCSRSVQDDGTYSTPVISRHCLGKADMLDLEEMSSNPCQRIGALRRGCRRSSSSGVHAAGGILTKEGRKTPEELSATSPHGQQGCLELCDQK